MAAFQFPDPALETTVVNPITGSTYQWKEPPGKWVVTVKMRDVGDIIWEGDNPPSPIGDYKLWYSTDTLELYFYYCDAAGTCAWVPTSAPITMLEDLDNTVFEIRRDLNQTNVAVAENENRIGRTIEYSDTAPTIYPEIEVTTDIVDVDGTTVIGQNTEYFFNELNYKFWYDTDRLELLVLYKDPDDGAYSYVPVSLPLTNIDLDSLNTQVQANSYSNNQQQQAIEALEGLIFGRVSKTGGDTMQGPLHITGDRTPNADGIESTLKVLNVDSAQSSTLNLKWDGATKVYVGEKDVTLVNDLKFNIGGKAIYAEGSDKKGFVVNNNGVFYDGNYTVDRHVATKKNVDEAIFNDTTDPDSNIYVKRTGDSMTGDLKMKGTAQIQFIDPPASGTLIRAGRADSQYPLILDLRHPGGAIKGGYDIKVQGNSSYNNLRFTNAKGTVFEINGGGGAQFGSEFQMDVSLDNNRIIKLGDAVEDTDAVNYGQVKEEVDNSTLPFETAIKAAGFQLGTFRYRRGSDSFVSGSIQSNTSTNPLNIVELKIWKSNQDGVQFGNDFYEKFITEKMYVHIRDKSSCSYVGRIDGIEMITNGIKLTLTPMLDEVDGAIYYENRYDVSIGYNKYGIKYPE